VIDALNEKYRIHIKEKLEIDVNQKTCGGILFLWLEKGFLFDYFTLNVPGALVLQLSIVNYLLSSDRK